MGRSTQIFSEPIDLDRLRAIRDRMTGPVRSKTTERAYHYDWKRFDDWCARTQLVSLPATDDTVSLFVAWLMHDHNGRAATASRHAAAIAAKHRDAKLENPITEIVRNEIRKTRLERAERPKRKRPLSPVQLESAVRWCDHTVAKGWRDRALLLFGFATTLRRSEIARLQLSDISFDDQGILVNVGKSKTDQEGVGRVVSVWHGRNPVTDPVATVAEWIKRRGAWEGPLFVRCSNRGDRVRKEPMSGDVICETVRRALQRAGIEGIFRYGAHSMRSGGITASADIGRSDAEIMELSGHRDPRMLRIYIRRTRAFQGRNPLEGVL